MVLADVAYRGAWGLGFGELAILAVVMCGVIALVYIALRRFGIKIPEWVAQALGVVLVCFVIIICIRLLLSM